MLLVVEIEASMNQGKEVCILLVIGDSMFQGIRDNMIRDTSSINLYLLMLTIQIDNRTIGKTLHHSNTNFQESAQEMELMQSIKCCHKSHKTLTCSTIDIWYNMISKWKLQDKLSWKNKGRSKWSKNNCIDNNKKSKNNCIDSNKKRNGNCNNSY